MMIDREASALAGTTKVDVGASSAGTVVMSSQTAAASAPQVGISAPVIFFDGVCGLCNRFVDFVLRRDTHSLFLFSPLQGQTAARRLNAADISDLKTVVVVDGDRAYRKSAAVIHVLARLGGFWRAAAGLLWIVPRPIRDLGYSWIANNRYAIFGKKETCRLPSAEERSRFLP
jgi:predicted DCC family thiol-disulfide oxidoreductase YuxK